MCIAVQQSVTFPVQCIVVVQCTVSSDTIVQHLAIVNPSGFLRILTSKNFSREIILLFVRMAFKLSKSGDTPFFGLGYRLLRKRKYGVNMIMSNCKLFCHTLLQCAK